MLADIAHRTTIAHVVENTKLPILAKYSIIHTLKCPKNNGEQDSNSYNYLKLVISLMFKYYSMPTKITKQKKKRKNWTGQ